MKPLVPALLLALVQTAFAQAPASQVAIEEIELSVYESVYRWSFVNAKYMPFDVRAGFVEVFLEDFVKNRPPNVSAERLGTIADAARFNVSIKFARTGAESFGYFDRSFTFSEARYVAESFSYEKVSLALSKLPVLEINVSPVPPRDYELRINGELAVVSDKTEYVVPTGMTKVEVSRLGIVVCSMQVSIMAGEKKGAGCRIDRQ